MYYLGVDGGGTKTAFILINERGEIKASVFRDTLYYFKIGMDRVVDTLNSGIREILEQTDIHLDDITAACIGLPGFGEIKADREKLEKAVSEGIRIPRMHLCNDVKLGWAGSLCCQPGINVVAGTGSIAIGVDARGNTERSGGWGSQIGGDEGSAHWIGMKLIQAFTKQSDGRCEKTLLYHYLKKVLNLEDDFEILDLAIHKLNMGRTEIAGFSKYAYDLAIQGDPAVIQLFDAAAYELYLMVQALCRKMDFGERIRVSYSGGVFNSEDYILQPLLKYLNPLNAELVKPCFSPSIGACLLACQIKNTVIDQQLLEGLKNQYK